MCRFLAPFVLTLILTAPGHASTFLVRPDGMGDYPTIQAAIDAVQDGDVISLTDGTFTGDGNRDITYAGKSITVRSQSGNPETCMINVHGDDDDPHTTELGGVDHGSPESAVPSINLIPSEIRTPGSLRCDRNAQPAKI